MNIGKMMQQAHKMQENIQKMQEELASMEVYGEAGGGMVKVTMGGDRAVRKVEIDPSLWADQDKDLLEDYELRTAVGGRHDEGEATGHAWRIAVTSRVLSLTAITYDEIVESGFL